MSARKPVRGISAVLASAIVVIVIGVSESVSGLSTVEDTAGILAALLVLVLVAAFALRVISRRTAHGWPRRAMTGLVAASAVLLVIMLVATVRGHTASARFEDQLAGFPLPAGYVSVPVTGHSQHASEPEHAVRAWEVPSGVDPCADLQRAFRAFTDGRVQTSSPGVGLCGAVAYDGPTKSAASVSEDGSTVVVEIWLEASSLIHF